MKYDDTCFKTLIKASEASMQYNVPLRTIYTWFDQGKIEGVNVNGKSLRIFSASLLDRLPTRRNSKKRVTER